MRRSISIGIVVRFRAAVAPQKGIDPSSQVREQETPGGVMRTRAELLLIRSGYPQPEGDPKCGYGSFACCI